MGGMRSADDGTVDGGTHGGIVEEIRYGVVDGTFVFDGEGG